MTGTPGLGAEQHCSSSSCVIIDIRLKFSLSKETLCVYFKLQPFLVKKNKICFIMVFSGGREKCQMEANIVFSGVKSRVQDLCHK